MRTFSSTSLPRLLEVLASDGYALVGPTVRDGAIVYERIDGADDLPRGVTEEQAPGRYRLVEREDDAYFGFAVGPQSLKRHLFPPREQLVRIRVRSDDAVAEASHPPGQPVAYIGLRACDLAAAGILDQVFAGGPYTDSRYVERRHSAFIVAVNCLEPGDLCFCVSMNTGPRVEGGYDLCLTELDGRFLVEVGTAAGQAVLDQLDTEPSSRTDASALQHGIEHAKRSMGRTMPAHEFPGLLMGNLEHPRWDDVAARCLSCGNCTQVCPTCFCHKVDNETVVGQEVATQTRNWDSCFTDDHSYIHGHQVRPTIRTRYRQWLTHKLDSWISQFGTSGCVGCGRCIAWCPVGIDITEEVAAIRSDPKPRATMPAPASYPKVAGDPLVPSPARLLEVIQETDDVFTLRLEPAGPFVAHPGQFNMLSLPGIGDPPISIAGHEGSTILHTIRAVGAATQALCDLQAGASVGIRGPFGSSWPLEEATGRSVTVIAGGIGLAPLRQALLHMLDRPDLYPVVRLLYGARSPADVLYDDELLDWNRRYAHFKASVTVDSAESEWDGHVGFVTSLIRRKNASPHGLYMLCGPEIMMQSCIRELQRFGVPDDHIYLSMERNMQCAAGFCGRCQYGPYFICKDGPIFRYDQVAFLLGQEGF